jgi:hypothetical protein
MEKTCERGGITMEKQPIGGTQTPSEGSYEEFLRSHPGRGNLKVQVSTARGTFPVAGALVEVTKAFDGVERVLYKNVTNPSGIVERMPLPALPVEYSQQESTAERSGTQYQVSVYHPGFMPLRFSTVEIYDGIETILPVPLEPLVR